MPHPPTHSRRAFLKTAATVASAAMASKGWPQEKSAAGMAVPVMKNGNLLLSINNEPNGSVNFEIEGWPGFHIGPLMPALTVDGTSIQPEDCETSSEQNPKKRIARYSFSGGMILTLEFEGDGESVAWIQPVLHNGSEKEATLNHVVLLGSRLSSGEVSFGADPASVRVLEQGNYWGRVVPITRQAKESSSQTNLEPNEAPSQQKVASDLVCTVYDRNARMAFLTGYESSERWLGRIELAAQEAEEKGYWELGFDGGDLLINPGETISLERVSLSAGPEPWSLLERYGDRVRNRHQPSIPDVPPVSWCSWYPYRLGVTDERLLETARIAAERLKPLGLSIIEVDLGWQKDQLPSTFEENDQFPQGLARVAEELEKSGFKLGVWTAPFTISEFDPLYKEHPEWLIADEKGEPAAYWTWFWAPHGKVFILDLTHPGAQEWLRTQMTSLYQRGVRYLKSDFIGCESDALARRRYNPRIVAGGGTEAGRIGARIIRESLPDALLLNCGGPEMPGSGHWPLLYSCGDTGNTGFLTSKFQQENYQALACHLFKNHRWGIIQPSCLCVGLPGGIEEARLRATIAFMAGGQIDISDTLTTLPEERWEILTATLPPLGISARPIDLFDPVYGKPGYAYSAACQEKGLPEPPPEEHPPGSVWHLHVKADWDEWDLVSLFTFKKEKADENPEIRNFMVPFSMLGLQESERLWGYDFWDRQALGTVPGKRRNPRDYSHPGDFQDLLTGDAPGALDISFVGPGVKLICLRRQRSHPWVLGTSFHQSCGTELRQVTWDDAHGILRGELHRPPGESGVLVIHNSGKTPRELQIDGEYSEFRLGANGSTVVPIVAAMEPSRWSLQFSG